MVESVVQSGPSIRARMVHEIREFAVLTAYLYVCFAVLIYYKAAVLEAAHIHYAPLGVAAVKAAICAKFMMLGNALNLGEGFRNHPLILPTVYKSFVFLLLLFVLTVIEEVVVGSIHGRAVEDSLAEIAGGTWAQLAATSFVVMLILMPYFAFRSLGELVGERNLLRLYFEKRQR